MRLITTNTVVGFVVLPSPFHSYKIQPVRVQCSQGRVDPRPTMVYTICLCEPKIISEANNVQEVDNLKKTIIIILTIVIAIKTC